MILNAGFVLKYEEIWKFEKTWKKIIMWGTSGCCISSSAAASQKNIINESLHPMMTIRRNKWSWLLYCSRSFLFQILMLLQIVTVAPNPVPDWSIAHQSVSDDKYSVDSFPWAPFAVNMLHWVQSRGFSSINEEIKSSNSEKHHPIFWMHVLWGLIAR